MLLSVTHVFFGDLKHLLPRAHPASLGAGEPSRTRAGSGDAFSRAQSQLESFNRSQAMVSQPGDVTRLLQAWRSGDPNALANLTPLIYNDLRRLARGYMRRERADHTLEPTALVHEVYLRLVDKRQARWQDRAHFYAVAARLMRRILVDHARARRTAKRLPGIGAGLPDGFQIAAPERSADLVALDDALAQLESLDPRKARIIELRFFGGLTISETAAITELSTATVIIETRIARAWLYAHLVGGTDNDSRAMAESAGTGAHRV
jgi:RNA polymerase sigma factor (TIGR02999 family)